DLLIFIHKICKNITNLNIIKFSEIPLVFYLKTSYHFGLGGEEMEHFQKVNKEYVFKYINTILKILTIRIINGRIVVYCDLPNCKNFEITKSRGCDFTSVLLNCYFYT